MTNEIQNLSSKITSTTAAGGGGYKSKSLCACFDFLFAYLINFHIGHPIALLAITALTRVSVMSREANDTTF